MEQQKHVVVSKRLVAINAASSIVTRILNVTVLVWMYQYLITRIPAEEFAVYPVVTAIMVFAPLFFAFVTSGISRYVVDAYARGDFDEVRTILSSMMPLLTLAAGIFLVAGLAFSAYIHHVLNIPPQMIQDAQIMMGLLVVSFIVQMMALPFLAGYHVKQRFVELNLLMVLRDLLRIALLLILLLTLETRVIWVVVATVISEMLFQIVTIIRARRMVPELRFDHRLVNWARARQLLGFGAWTSLGRLGATMYTNAATLILNFHGSAVDITSYFIGATFFRQLEGLIGTAITPLLPVLTAMNAEDDRQRFTATVFRGGRYGLWVAMMVVTPLMIYADDFILLYLGPDYAQASMVIILFMIIFPFNHPTVLLPLAAMAMARVREFFLPAFLFQLAGLGLMFLFTAGLDMGAIGVTMALTIITIGSQLSYYWQLCLKLTDRPFRDFASAVLKPGLAPAVAGTIAWTGMKLAVPIESWLTLFICAGTGGCVYLAVLFGFCLDKSERHDVKAGLAKLRNTLH